MESAMICGCTMDMCVPVCCHCFDHVEDVCSKPLPVRDAWATFPPLSHASSTFLSAEPFPCVLPWLTSCDDRIFRTEHVMEPGMIGHDHFVILPRSFLSVFLFLPGNVVSVYAHIHTHTHKHTTFHLYTQSHVMLFK